MPVAFLPENYALTIAAMCYNGKLDFSLLGDYDAMPDIDEVGAIRRGGARRAAGGGGEADQGRGPLERRQEERATASRQ